MEPERRRQIEDLFEEILEKPRSEWDEAIASACGRDPELEKEVRNLLSAHERNEGLLDRAPPFLDLSRSREDQDLREERVGRYKILQEIGRGGMGRVYLAKRADGQFKQRVAVKIIPWADPELQARVVAERQILASLEHPNIGRLLDGGVTGDGRPFLVMEYVDGLPLDVYCDRMRLNLRKRLKVFLTVLGAVEHAHNNLVVHRDLKPSNILVTPSGEVKLLDFGIAKLLNPSLGAETPLTRREDRALTPEYASPEQVRGEAITTSADVYSLGVVLYTILSGFRPYRLPDRALPKLVEVICERDPLPPSECVARAGRPGPSENEDDPTPQKAAEARHTTSHRLRQQLQGDLDSIVMKALRKEPGRRYASLAFFSQDLQHYLRGLPVGARRGNRWYRTKKFIRRHSVEAVAASLVILSLVMGTGAALWQAGVAARERDRAREALDESEEVTDFLLGLFEASDPLEAPGDTATVLDLLRRGERRADALAGAPLVQARMFQVMAQAHQNLGRFSTAESLAGEAVSRLEAVHGSEHPDVASALLLQGVALRNSGLYERSRAVLDRAITIQEKVLGPESAEVGRTLEEFSGLSVYLGDLAKAEDQARRALAIQENSLGTDAPTTLNTLSNLGAVLRYQGKYNEADTTFRAVLDGRRRLESPDPRSLSKDLLLIGDLRVEQLDDPEGAEAAYQEALSVLKGAAPEEQGNLVWALTSLGEALERRGEIEEASRHFLEAMETRQRAYGTLHPLVAESMGDYGDFLTRNGRLEEAEAVLLQAIDIHRNTVGLDHPRSMGNLTALGQALAAQGRVLEADSVVSEALETRRRALGQRTPVVAETMGILADIKILHGDYAAAEDILNQALDIVGDQPPGANIPRALHAAFVRLYEAWGRPEDANRHRAPGPSRS